MQENLTMKKIIGLVVFLLIELSSCGELRFDNKWEINIYVPFHLTTCNGMLLTPRLFIADGNCVNIGLTSGRNKTYSDIYINHVRGLTVYKRLAEVEKKNIFYNEDLSTEFDKSKRNVAVLITNQPLVSDDNRSLLMYLTQYLYDEIPSYNEQSQLMNLPNTEEIQYSNCIVPVSRGINYNVDPCIFLDKSFWCKYESIRTSDSDENRINFVICSVKETNRDVLVGIVPESNQRENRIIGFDNYVEIDYIGDLGNAIYEKYKNWLAENPNQLIYQSYNAGYVDRS